MSRNLLPLIEGFRDLRVAVIGDVMLDELVHGSTERLCREAPVPVVKLQEQVDAPGGAGNTAANLACLGARVALVGAIGEDELGVRLLDRLIEAHVDVTGVLPCRGDQGTLCKTRLVAGSQLLLRMDRGDPYRDAVGGHPELLSQIERACEQADVVVISDYGYGVVSEDVIALLDELQTRRPVPLVIDSKDVTRFAHLEPAAVKPNFEEVTRLLGASASMLRGEPGDQLQALGERVLSLTGARIAAVTLDSEGALIFEAGRAAYRTYARPYPDSRATGAGDTFVAAMALAMAAGADAPSAAEVASAAAAIVVGKEGTCTCSADELIDAMTGDEKIIEDLPRFSIQLEEKRRQGRRVVFTNGCFDILHRGHIAYLNAAKAQGDLLVVGVNTDGSVQRLKGPERPINCLEDRLQVLGALSCIDFLVAFEDDTPAELIRAVRPDVFVKGGDYTIETLPEASLVESLGGRIELVPYVEDHSTTGMINRMRNGAAI
jgi:D-beta-D-heptose 7-phosphate kinase/D-beta-D-heptose 1-phosphate adenosyltransferase